MAVLGPECNLRYSVRQAGMPLAAGRRFGPYEVISPLGAGGMGEVYRARDQRLQRDGPALGPVVSLRR